MSSTRESRFFKIFLVGFLIFCLQDVSEMLIGNTRVLTSLCGLAIIFGSLFIYKVEIVNELNSNISILFKIFIVWIFYIVLKPLLIDGYYSNDSIYPQNTYGLTSYLLPFIVFVGKRSISLRVIFQIIYFSVIIGLCLFFLTIDEFFKAPFTNLVNLGKLELSIGSLANVYGSWLNVTSFTVLCLDFVPGIKKKLIIFSSLLILVIYAYLGRRGGAFMYLLSPVCMLYLYGFGENTFERKFKFVLVILGLFVLYFVGEHYLDNPFFLLRERLEIDNRSGVDFDLMQDLSRENSWMLGKGLNGTYKSADFEAERYYHETGYLYLILKGGVVYLILYIAVLLHASYLGFFRSKNSLIKGFSLYIFIHLVYLIPFGLPSFGIEYLLVWVAFLYCESKFWREMTSEQIKMRI